MTSNIYKLRNVLWSHRRFQAGIPGPEEQIEAALDFWLSVLFPKSLACPEDAGHWEGSKLQDWHHRRMEISFQHCQTPSPAYRHSTPSASWPWRCFQPLVPKECFAHASPGSLHFYDVSDHICPPSSATQQGTGVVLFFVSSISAQTHLSFFPPHSLDLISR